MTRPGVPMMICAPPFKERICFVISCPPYTGRILIPCIYLLNLRISSATWIASSLVGERIMTCVFLLSGSTFSSIGIPNAAVFPLPVCAWPITSLPLNTTGIACAWIGDASSNPISLIPRRICGLNSNSSNLNVSIYFLSFIKKSCYTIYKVTKDCTTAHNSTCRCYHSRGIFNCQTVFL